MSSVYDTYKQKGAAVVRAKPDIALKELEQLVTQLYDKYKSGNFFYSLLSLPVAESQAISAKITALFSNYLTDALPGYRFITGSFLSKPSNTHSELYLHQDWSYTDENIFLPVTCWLPLCKTDSNSGGMFVIEESHNIDRNICSNSYETLRIMSDTIEPRLIKHINTSLADILLFHPKTWHGSHPNNSSFDRIVLTCMALPVNAPLLYYHRISNHQCRIHKLYDGAFEESLPKLVKNEIPDSFIQVADINYTHQPKLSVQ